MSSTGPPCHSDRSKSRKSSKNLTKIPMETPKRSYRPSGRLGPVISSATPQRAGERDEKFKAERRERQARHAARMAKEPELTFIVGGVNPFDQDDVVEAVKKFKKLVAEKFFPTGKGANITMNSTKLVFREEEEEEEKDDGREIGGEGHSTIVID